MLMRLWTTRVAPGREEEYLAFAQERSRVMFLEQPGCLGVFFLRHPDGRRTACSLWRGVSDIDALGRSATYQATAKALADSGILSGPADVSVHEVEGGALDPAALRAAAGGAQVAFLDG